MHVGTDDTYLALYQGREDHPAGTAPIPERRHLNHLAYEVDDLGALRERLRTAGFQESGSASAHPYRRRVYFHDTDGHEWEFVQYLHDDPAKRHDYELPDRPDFRS